jgi:cytochrome c oxidase assembly factor CtaG
MIQWWCAATGLPWDWRWQWYPGVHLALILLAIAGWGLGRAQGWTTRPWGWFVTAWLTLLVTLDWPIGKLGAGYLASVHTLQFLLLTLLIAPALLRSIPVEGWHALAPEGSMRHRVLRTMARAIPGLLCYNLIVITTHFPAVVDPAMQSQVGSFLIDGAWLVGGLILWWPLVAPAPFARLGTFPKMGYIFAATIVPTVPAMMMVFSEWPLYALYELAPRVDVRFSANEDIMLAGLVMKVIGDIPLWITMAVIFFRGTARDALANG